MSKYASTYAPGVGDADTLDGLHAAAFALAAHDHTTMAHVVGVPLDNQIAFWAGANTLEGEVGFEWDSTDMKVPGNMRSSGEVVAYDSGAAGPDIWTLLPVDNVTLKFAANLLSIKPDIAGNALKVLRVDAAGTALEWAAAGGGVPNHSALTELDYASAMHTGFSPTIHNFVDTTNHPVAGLTANHFLKALSPTTYGFAAIAVANVVGAAPTASPTFTGTVTLPAAVNIPDNGILLLRTLPANNCFLKFDSATETLRISQYLDVSNRYIQLGGTTVADVWTPQLTLNTKNGNVGIGFTSSLSKLCINGGLHVGGESDAGDNNLLVDGTAVVMGNTGLAGCTSPSQALEIGTNTRASYCGIVLNAAANQQKGIAFRSAGVDNWYVYSPVSSTDLRFFNGAADKMILDVNGNLTCDADIICYG